MSGSLQGGCRPAARPGRVSVVLPLFNGGRFVAEAIASVEAQSHQDFELLVGDDGSQDEGPGIVAARAAADPRIRLLRLPHRGVAATLNRLIAEAENEEVAVMHADDLMRPRRLERQLAFLGQNPAVAVVSSNVLYVDAEGRRIGSFRSNLKAPGDFRRCAELGRVECFHHPAVMLRRSVVAAVGGYREGLEVAEDLNLWLRIAEAGYDLAVLPEPLTCYRIHARQTSVRRHRELCLQELVEQLNFLRRRKGEPELMPADLPALIAAWPLYKRARFSQRLWAELLYKRSAESFAGGRVLASVAYAGAAALCAPLSMPRRIAGKLR